VVKAVEAVEAALAVAAAPEVHLLVAVQELQPVEVAARTLEVAPRPVQARRDLTEAEDTTEVELLLPILQAAGLPEASFHLGL